MTFPILPTVAELNLNVYDAIAHLESLKVHISKPTKPDGDGIKIKTSSEHREFVDKLEAYEVQLEVYKAEQKECQAHNLKVDSLINQFICQEAGLDRIPEQYRNKVYSKAWSDGHSSGYHSVYQELCELIDIFE